MQLTHALIVDDSRTSATLLGKMLARRELSSDKVDSGEACLDYLADRAGAGHKLLIVDDVHDTGLSLRQLVADIEEAYGTHTPEIRLATPWYKPGNNQTGRIPDYYVHESDDWLVFPHELEGLTIEEIATHKPELSELLERLSPHLPQ